VFDSDVGGKPTKLSYIEVQVLPTLFTYQAEASIDGGPWAVIAQGKVAKAGYLPHGFYEADGNAGYAEPVAEADGGLDFVRHIVSFTTF